MSKKLCVLLAVAAVCMATAVWAAPAAKTYEWTGVVTELTDATIVVQKGEEKWEIARTADTKTTGELKVGSKVTVKYRMTATAVTVKGEGK